MSDDIRSGRLQSQWIEEDPAAPLGAIAFATNRYAEDVPQEKNTPLEDSIYDAMLDLAADNKPLPPGIASSIRDIMDSGMYPRTFRRPAASEVYRGMKVSEEWLVTALGDVPDNSSGEVVTNFTYKPLKGETSSWTLEAETARNFCYGTPKTRYGVILTAYSDDNPESFFDIDEMYGLRNFIAFGAEHEVVGFGPIRVAKLRWFTRTAIGGGSLA